MNLTTDDFDYDLPEALIAQQPLPRRDQSRLMVLSRPSGRLDHRVFRELPALLRAGDVLVLNDTRVIPARFFCRRATGGAIEGLFLEELATGRWEVLLRGAGKCRPAEALALDGCPGGEVRLLENLGEGRWAVAVAPPAGAAEILERAGSAPLPPYIRRAGPAGEEDRRRYQTVYAARPGAVAAPTAGLHFTEDLLKALDQAGVRAVRLTLHVGPGTFTPVKARTPQEHRMHSESYDLPAEAADALNAARAEGRRIVAVGTTSVRVLETVAAADGRFRPGRGTTDIFIYPPHVFRAADALITNFHLPRSTLLMLTAAFCSPGRTGGLKTVLHAYAEAVRLGYRFYSYGDAMLIE